VGSVLDRIFSRCVGDGHNHKFEVSLEPPISKPTWWSST
jgi:hypothetical protein